MKVKSFFVGISMFASMLSFGQHIPTDSTTTEEEVVETPVRLFAPNAFTPDGDYYNDTWGVYIEGIDIYDFHLVIFSRSGEVIWESYNSGAQWDGNFGDFPAPDGVYAWFLEAKEISSDKRIRRTGSIVLMR